MFQVQTNVPIPTIVRNKPPIRRKYPFLTMQIGEMFFVPNKTKNTLATHASSVGRKAGRKFLSRLAYMAETTSGWEPCEADDEDAVLGIAVWRTK